MTGARYITLPNGRKVGLGVYVKAWRALAATANGDALFPGFYHFPEPARVILAEMRHGVHARINRHIPGFGCGRKWGADYQTQAYRDARRARDAAQRIRVYSFETPEAARRLSHLITERGEV